MSATTMQSATPALGDWSAVNARHAAFSRARIYELARRDIMPHIKVAGRYYFDLAAIDRWLTAGGSSVPGEWRQMI